MKAFECRKAHVALLRSIVNTNNYPLSERDQYYKRMPIINTFAQSLSLVNASFEMQQTTDTISTQTLTTPAMGAHILPPPAPRPGNASNTPHTQYALNIRFTDQQMKTQFLPETRQLKNVINGKIQNKDFFYGIEIMAHTYQPNTTLDYSALGPLLPVFTSIVWLGIDYWKVSAIEDVEAIQLAHKLYPNAIVVPHFSCFRLEEERLRRFLNLKFSNILAIRGDHYKMDQAYTHSSELVEAIRQIRGESITIGVAGYPEGHPECKSVEEDMGNLIKKVSSGADFIITQICFSSQAIVDFIQRCRLASIEIPIIVGIFVPDNFRMLETILRITKIHMPSEELTEYRTHAALGGDSFTELAVAKAVQMIDAVLNSDDVVVYGLQFFTMNKFENIPKVLKQIVMKNKI